MTNIIMSDDVESALKGIFEKTNPISIFIYGSRARKDFKPTSDYEVGVLYKRENKPRRSELATLHDVKEMNVYPFVIEEIEKYNLDTPFPKAIYLRELIGSSKTVFGEKIMENMELPEIRLTDLLERAAFDVATGFAAFRSFKSNDLETAAINFKSVLFGTRILEILELKKFPYSYDEIFELSKELNLSPEYRALIDHAYEVRKEKKVEEQYLFTNISFINQEVLVKVKHQIFLNGDQVVLDGKKIEW